MSSAASSSVNYVDTVEALLFFMSDYESSESPPNYWSELLESANRPKGRKAVPSKTLVPKAIGKVASSSAIAPGGKGAYS
eukprot:11166145-Lingulodinium_polyedra.AAC.1